MISKTTSNHNSIFFLSKRSQKKQNHQIRRAQSTNWHGEREREEREREEFIPSMSVWIDGVFPRARKRESSEAQSPMDLEGRKIVSVDPFLKKNSNRFKCSGLLWEKENNLGLWLFFVFSIKTLPLSFNFSLRSQKNKEHVKFKI